MAGFKRVETMNELTEGEKKMVMGLRMADWMFENDIIDEERFWEMFIDGIKAYTSKTKETDNCNN